ncbi:helix-turn-helix domain-containing protein, partial [Brevibacillus laterosporus]|nr:helix-turn-helix domain-containing protein [Brevibacillus laterosporus]
MAQKKDKTMVRIIKRENPFVQIDKTPINDDRLSWKAKGLLVYLLSKPDDWTIMIIDLIKHAKDGRDSVYSGLKELEHAGYLSRVRER